MNQQYQSFQQLLDLPATHNLQFQQPSQSELDFQGLPPQHRISEKLMQNKLRKLQLQSKHQKQKQLLLQRRRNRQKQISQFFKMRQRRTQEQRQAHLRGDNNHTFINKSKSNDRSYESLNKFQASEAMINNCRKKKEQKRNQYVIRIQSKTRQRHQRAQLKRQILRQAIDKTNQDTHLQQWRQYQAQLIKKHQNSHSPPDRLYQEYKLKNNVLHTMMGFGLKQNNKRSTLPISQIQQIKQSKSSKNLLTINKKVQYFGVYGEDMIQATTKDIIKMRRFIEQYSFAEDPSKDENLIEKFEQLLLNQILI